VNLDDPAYLVHPEADPTLGRPQHEYPTAAAFDRGEAEVAVEIHNGDPLPLTEGDPTDACGSPIGGFREEGAYHFPHPAYRYGTLKISHHHH
jgi:hypothetical protein